MARSSRPISTAVLVLLPVLAVAGVAFAMLGVAAPRAHAALRLYGGPSEGARELSWLANVVERVAGIERPLPNSELVIEGLLSDRRRALWRGRLDAGGVASPVLGFASAPADRAITGPVRVRAWLASRPDALIASGEIAVDPRVWSGTARRRGGWLPVKSHGALEIQVAAGRGTWATSFADPLVVEVRADGTAVSGARITVQPEGCDVAGGRTLLVTDSRGRAAVAITPRESVVIVGLDVTAPDGAAGRWYGTLPVVTGALHAERVGQRLVVRSPVVREGAFFSLVDLGSRRAGGPIPLTPDGRGGSVGEVKIDVEVVPGSPLWAVVSAESDLDTESTVGWPLFSRDEEPFQLTFDVADRLLLDGAPLGDARQHQKSRRASLLGSAFAALCLLIVAILIVERARAADRTLRKHLSEFSEEPGEAERSARPLVVQVLLALLCLGLATTALGMWLVVRGG
jgi:hypothetical protein